MASEYVDDGIVFLRSQNVLPFRIDLINTKRITQTFHDRLKKSALTPGDVVTVRTGKPGSTAVIPEALSVANCSDLVITRPGSSLDSRWLSYYINGAAAGFVSSRLVGAVQQHFNVGAAKEMELLLPSLEEQRAIAATLGALDDKIASNHRATAAGESLIRTLVESALDATDGEGGTLGDYCTLVRAPVKVEAINADDNYIGLEHMPRGSIFLTEWESAEGLGSNKTAFHRGDVLFGKLRPYFKKVGIAPIRGVCSTDVLVLRAKEASDTALVACVAASKSLIDSLSAGSTGTRMPRASWKDLAAWPVPLLTAYEREALATEVNQLYHRLEHLTFESKRLAALRDALLPELLSGRMRVAEAQEVAA